MFTSGTGWEKKRNYYFVIELDGYNLKSEVEPTKEKIIAEAKYILERITVEWMQVYLKKFSPLDIATLRRAYTYGGTLAGMLNSCDSLQEAWDKVENFYAESKWGEMRDFLKNLKTLNFEKESTSLKEAFNSHSQQTFLTCMEERFDNLAHEHGTIETIARSSSCEEEKYNGIVKYRDVEVYTFDCKSPQQAISYGQQILKEMQTPKGEDIIRFFKPDSNQVWNDLYELDDNDPLLKDPNLNRIFWIETYFDDMYHPQQEEMIRVIRVRETKKEEHPCETPLTEEEQEMLDEFLAIKSPSEATDFVELANHPKTEGLSIDFIGEDSDYEWNYKGNTSSACFASAREAYVDFVAWLIESLTSFQDDSDIMENRIIRTLNNDME